jgi:hypothetical protein
MRLAFLEFSIPLSAIVGSPSVRFVPVVVTLNTGVRRFQSIREFWPRHPHAVIPAGIDDHVSALHHVTLHTEISCGIVLVKVMGMNSIFFLEMASVTQSISLDKDLAAVGFVTVSAAHSCLEHFALQERAINIDLLIDLAVGIVKLLFQDARGM